MSGAPKKQTLKSLRRKLYEQELWELKSRFPEVAEAYGDDQIVELWLEFSKCKGGTWIRETLNDINIVFKLALTRPPSIYKIHQ